MTASDPAPRWMRAILLAAGAYNVVWGAFVVLFPTAMFRWLEMPLPNYPQLWQCIGMIVGVYGIGYAIAAFDPVRHWPIVLVGFLGKVFGPLGMLQALWTGALPWGFSLNCVTNDLVWWVPFFLILRHAWKQQRPASAEQELPDEATLLKAARTSEGRSLAEISRSQPTLVVFLRHSGCTFCREALADIGARRAQIESEGTGIALVHMSSPEAFGAFAKAYGLEDLPAVSDPTGRLYRGIGLRRGTVAQLFGWSVWRRAMSALLAGHRVGWLDGDATQMPGAFLIQNGQVVRRYMHANAADRPDYLELCRLPTPS
jgi:peroxiredoxin